MAAAAERAGHSVQLIDLQCESHRDFFRSIQRWRPDVIAFSGNYGALPVGPVCNLGYGLTFQEFGLAPIFRQNEACIDVQ